MGLSRRPSDQNGGHDLLGADFHSEVGRYIYRTHRTYRYSVVILVASEVEESIGYVGYEIVVVVDVWSVL